MTTVLLSAHNELLVLVVGAGRWEPSLTIEVGVIEILSNVLVMEQSAHDRNAIRWSRRSKLDHRQSAL